MYFVRVKIHNGGKAYINVDRVAYVQETTNKAYGVAVFTDGTTLVTECNALELATAFNEGVRPDGNYDTD